MVQSLRAESVFHWLRLYPRLHEAKEWRCELLFETPAERDTKRFQHPQPAIPQFAHYRSSLHPLPTSIRDIGTLNMVLMKEHIVQAAHVDHLAALFALVMLLLVLR